MGNAQSGEHSSHFRRPEAEETTTAAPEASDEDPVPAHLINISNKMVERLVEEHQMYKEMNKPRNDRLYQDKMFIERLKCMDESHSEEIGLLTEDLDALVSRVHVRAAKIVRLQPVCGDCESEVLNCYSNNWDKTLCNDEIAKFKKCVSEQTSLKLLTRISDMEDEQFRKSRDLENARKHNFWGNFEPQNTNT